MEGEESQFQAYLGERYVNTSQLSIHRTDCGSVGPAQHSRITQPHLIIPVEQHGSNSMVKICWRVMKNGERVELTGSSVYAFMLHLHDHLRGYWGAISKPETMG